MLCVSVFDSLSASTAIKCLCLFRPTLHTCADKRNSEWDFSLSQSSRTNVVWVVCKFNQSSKQKLKLFFFYSCVYVVEVQQSLYIHRMYPSTANDNKIRSMEKEKKVVGEWKRRKIMSRGKLPDKHFVELLEESYKIHASPSLTSPTLSTSIDSSVGAAQLLAFGHVYQRSPHYSRSSYEWQTHIRNTVLSCSVFI